MNVFRPMIVIWLFGVLWPLMSPERTRGEESLILRLPASQHARHRVPVSFPLPPEMNGIKTFSLVRVDDDQPVSVQFDEAVPPRLAWMLEKRLEPGESRSYRLEWKGARPDDAAGVRLQDDGKRLVVSVDGKPVLAYNQATVPSPDPAQPYYARSGFIHPVYSPDGDVLTDDFPPDHLHQHAVMFAWTSAEVGGRPVNFWDQARQEGRVRHARMESTCEGPVFGGFTAVVEHVDTSLPGKETVAIEERWQVRVYRRSGGFLFDLESTQRRVTHEPVAINQYHYGGMAIRGRRNWFEPGQGDFLTSQGMTRRNGNHTRPHWCDIHGLTAGRPAGVTLFCHPGNFRAPQPVRLHPTKPYFCWAPMVLGPFEIVADKPLVSRYRFFAHSGPLDPQVADELWQDYAQPLVAQLDAEK